MGVEGVNLQPSGDRLLTNALNTFRADGPPPDGLVRPPFMQALKAKGSFR